MSKEGPPLQFDMFTGEAVDNRTRQQKKLDKEREQPKQTEMFSQREIAQFGVNPHPLLPLSPNTKLLLIPEDPAQRKKSNKTGSERPWNRRIRCFLSLRPRMKLITRKILAQRLPQTPPHWRWYRVG